MKKEVFVSYASADRACAMDIVGYLEEREVSCFIAPRDIDPGVAYASSLMNALEDASVVVLVASVAMNSSEHVLNEIDVVVSKKIPFIPFFIEDFEMNDDFRYYLGRKQYILAYDNYSDYFNKLYKAIEPYLTRKPEKPVAPAAPETDNGDDVSANTKTIFEYFPDRGIMVNPADHQRNISFRNDTLINLLSRLYYGIESISDRETADKLFYETGFSSGNNFAQRLNEQIEMSASHRVGLSAKIDTWCDFDSNVGWGRFLSDIHIDEEEGELSGTLTISECFLIDKKDQTEICFFIKGYCEGILEKLLGNIPVELKCISCPMKNKFKSACVFSVGLKESY
ncbi:MAG: toll/interleukin-1 receptor domain-containing protein [Clostridiales bacterium]|nr:toll/interleukin-1 receptor domain-containing protein [Clostridiales bacterium]